MALKTTGSTNGKSNKLGFGGQSQQLKNAGVPGGVIGNLARKAGTAPGMANFHGGKKKKNRAAKATFYEKGARDTSDDKGMSETSSADKKADMVGARPVAKKGHPHMNLGKYLHPAKGG